MIFTSKFIVKQLVAKKCILPYPLRLIANFYKFWRCLLAKLSPLSLLCTALFSSDFPSGIVVVSRRVFWLGRRSNPPKVSARFGELAFLSCVVAASSESECDSWMNAELAVNLVVRWIAWSRIDLWNTEKWLRWNKNSE
jgi:hypothetical protein